VSITLSQIYAGLRYADGARWPGMVISYSLPSAGESVWSPSAYGPGSEPFDPAYGLLDAAQRSQFTAAITSWGRVSGIMFMEMPDNAGATGQIRVAFTDAASQGAGGAAAYAYTPPPPGFSIGAKNGDIWIDDSHKTADPSPGGFLYSTFLHEIGHALGLKHPFEGTPLPAEFDNLRYTVMSYTEAPDGTLRTFNLQGSTLFASGTTVNPSTPMLLDIAAIQGIYGPSPGTATGANVYTFDEARPILMTLFDTGGVDTLDLSAHTRASSVDLTPGAFSSIAIFSVQDQIAFWTARFPGFGGFISNFLSQPDTYIWRNNVATSPETTIENVIGGVGADTIIGNAAANSLSGGAGADSIAAGAGADTVIGGAGGAAGNYLRGDDGDDVLTGGADFDDINGNMGNDTVSTGAGNDFCVGGRDNDLLFGEDGADFTYGNLGNDTCHGGNGDDIIRGGQGNDTLSGGAGADFVSGDRGDDTMVGGAGADSFHSSNEAGIDRVLDFSIAEGDRVQLDPGTTFSVSQIGADTIITVTGGQVILVGVAMSSLLPTSIFGA
jgi:serralysin